MATNTQMKKWYEQCKEHIKNCNDESCELYWSFVDFCKQEEINID